MDLSRLIELVWIGGLAATPIVVGVSVLCRSPRLRPATKHALWAAALASFLTPLAVAAVWRNTWFESDRMLSLADRVLPAGTTSNAEGTVHSANATDPAAKTAISGDAPLARRAAKEPERTVAKTPLQHPIAMAMKTAEGFGTVANPSADRVTACVDATHGAAGGAANVAAGGAADDAANMPVREVASPFESLPVMLAAEHGTEGGSVASVASEHRSENTLAARGADLTHGPDDGSVARGTGTHAPVSKEAAPSAGSTSSAPAWWTSLRGGVSRSTRATLAKLVAVRDAIADLPPVPIYVWIGVAAFLVFLRLCRSMALRRIIARARPAPRRVRALVDDMAGVMGLAAAPEALTTEARISPMVWCGVRPKLVIPEDLWASLDDDSRRAVIAHELAHLKRGDHVLHWIAALVGAAYWWHPAAWWARRKMNEEAEASCDAWVTSLFPRRRRAYAEALLVTSSFLGSPAYHAGPALGVVNGRSKLARRITMVMTQRTAPKVSKLGAAVATLVLATGALVTPGLACPPEKEAKTAKTTSRTILIPSPSGGGAAGSAFLGEAPAIDAMIQAEKAQAEKAAKAKNKSKKKRTGQTSILVPGGASTPVEAIVIPGGSAGGGGATTIHGGDEARALYEQAARQAETVARAYSDQAAQVHADGMLRAYTTARSAEAAAQASQNAARQAERSARDAARAGALRQRLARIPGATAPTPALPPTPPAEPMAPMAPMAPMVPSNPFGSTAPRADAALVTPWGQATAPSMSGPAEGTEPREYHLPSGKLEALSELMARQDVPIWIERGAGKIVVHATPEQHEVFGAFVKLINPDGSTGDGASAGGLTRTLSTLLGRVRGDRPNADALRAQLESLTSQREAHEERLDTIRERAERIREQAERFREMAEELREKAGDADDDRSRDALRRAEQELSLQGDGLETQAVDLEAQLAFFESQVESLESAIESMEEQIEAIDEVEMAAITTDAAPEIAGAGDLLLAAPVDVVAPTPAEGDSDEDADEDSDEDSEVDLVIPADVLDETPAPQPAPQPAPAPTAPATPSSLR